jgi:hypothetical protein
MGDNEAAVVGSGGANKPETTESTSTDSSLPTPANDPSASPQDGRSDDERGGHHRKDD